MTCGVLPIDKMREHVGPISLILSKIPKEVLEAHYKITLPPRDNKKLYTVSTFLSTYAAKKGWFTGRSLPAEIQAAKYIMKEFTTGKLAFVHLRPDFDPSKHKKV
jgi:large subunit GTPase 1